MKKRQRILKNTEFSSIIQKRQSVSSPAFVLYFQPRAQELPRVGISVGKKIGKAVVRTRVKRQTRALIDSVCTFEEPFDSILIVRPGFHKLTCGERETMLAALMQRAAKKLTGGTHEKNTA